MIFEDVENDIPVNNIQLSQGLSSVNVKVVKTSNDGFTETKIERVKLQNDKLIFVARPFCSSRPISNTISLSIEDVRRAVQLANAWQVFDSCFRKVLVYGKVDVLNYYSRNDKRTTYKLLVDDGSGTIIATLNITKESVNAVAAKTARLTIERNKLKRKQEIGFNINGKFLSPESEECISLLRNISNLHSMTLENIRKQRKPFQLGPIPKKALLLGTLYTVPTKGVQLNVIDVTLDDQIELSWKRQLNNLYTNHYLKTTEH